MKLKRLALLALLLTIGAPYSSADFDGNTYSRADADTDPVTMKARREFDQLIKKSFADSKSRHRVSNLRLTKNQRMVAQRARGAASANSVLPVEVDRIVKLIGLVRTQREHVIQTLIRMRSFENYNRADIENAVTALAATGTLHLDYWGYIGRSERLIEYSSGSRELKYFAKWNERQSRYELYSEAALQIRIIRGIIESRKNTGNTWWPF